MLYCVFPRPFVSWLSCTDTRNVKFWSGEPWLREHACRCDHGTVRGTGPPPKAFGRDCSSPRSFVPWSSSFLPGPVSGLPAASSVARPLHRSLCSSVCLSLSLLLLSVSQLPARFCPLFFSGHANVFLQLRIAGACVARRGSKRWAAAVSLPRLPFLLCDEIKQMPSVPATSPTKCPSRKKSVAEPQPWLMTPRPGGRRLLPLVRKCLGKRRFREEWGKNWAKKTKRVCRRSPLNQRQRERRTKLQEGKKHSAASPRVREEDEDEGARVPWGGPRVWLDVCPFEDRKQCSPEGESPVRRAVLRYSLKLGRYASCPSSPLAVRAPLRHR